VIGNLTVTSIVDYQPINISGIPITVYGCVDLSSATLRIRGDCIPQNSILISSTNTTQCNNKEFGSTQAQGSVVQTWVSSTSNTNNGALSIVTRCNTSISTSIIVGSVVGGVALLTVIGLLIGWYFYTNHGDCVRGVEEPVDSISVGLNRPLLSQIYA